MTSRPALPRIAIVADARLSPCRTYRYWLWRGWDSALQPMVWVMLNPSTADELADDRTIRACIDFAKRLGYGSIVVVNLFAFRATDPHLLNSASPVDLVGPDNNAEIAAAVAGRTVVAAWGSHGDRFLTRVAEVMRILRGSAKMGFCVGRTKTGEPRHPLYVKRAQPLETYWQ